MSPYTLATCIVMASVAGCMSATYETYRDRPLVAQVENGMSKQDVLRIGGQPLAQSTRTAAPGTCLDYQLTQGTQQQPYFVSFDAADKVDHKDFKTCAQWSAQQQKAKQPEGIGGMGGIGGSGY
ncbi:Osmotically-inducible lipoprotein E precursor [compost metagenome]